MHWAVKTVSDRRGRRSDYHLGTSGSTASVTSPGRARSATHPPTAPAPVPHLRVRIRLKAATHEDDRDFHLIISPRNHPRHEMITRLPSVHCHGAAGSIKRLPCGAPGGLYARGS